MTAMTTETVQTKAMTRRYMLQSMREARRNLTRSTTALIQISFEMHSIEH